MSVFIIPICFLVIGEENAHYRNKTAEEGESLAKGNVLCVGLFSKKAVDPSPPSGLDLTYGYLILDPDH